MTDRIDLLLTKVNKILNLIYKYRYYIAIVLFILCVVFEISGSSIAQWKYFGFSDVENDGVIFGKVRPIRSDEYAVLTALSFSQKFDGFNYFSNLVRGDTTDVFIVYGLPVLNFMQIFRPFQIGFLFLGLAKGLSFFWYGRMIALFLVMIELFMIITNKNKLLSVIGSIMITLAPMMQWWFAVNGIAEIFIFGGLAIVLLDKYMKTQNLKKRCLYLLGIAISAGGYILVFYPAWQIPMAYVFLILAIWDIIKNKKECKINQKDIMAILVTIIVLAICMGYILSKSYETIKIVLNTAYPGTRSENGGGIGIQFFDYITNIFLPFKNEPNMNQCTEARMFGLFPIGIILSFIVLVREKKKDLLLLLTIIIYIFMSIWLIIGVPEIISKITLMSKSTPKRAIIVVGVLDSILLLRSLAIIKKPVKFSLAIAISVIISLVIVLTNKFYNTAYMNITCKMIIIMIIVSIYLFYFSLRYKTKYSKYLFTIGIVPVMIISGATVNPIQKGVDVIYKSTLIKEVQKINNEEKGKWITADADFPLQNFILLAGVPVINSTNTYPDLDRWHELDKDRKYEEIYNRYAHIQVEIIQTNDSVQDKFEQIRSDQFKVYLTPDELKQLEVKYIVSTHNDLEKFNSNKYEFENIIRVYDAYSIYKINYN